MQDDLLSPRDALAIFRDVKVIGEKLRESVPLLEFHQASSPFHEHVASALSEDVVRCSRGWVEGHERPKADPREKMAAFEEMLRPRKGAPGWYRPLI